MRTFGVGHPLVFNHIPKTAGTSLVSALRAAVQPEAEAEFVDMSLTRSLEGVDDVTRSLFVQTPEDLPADATFVIGHLAPSTTRARYPDGEHVTFLRNPQARVISHWLHVRATSQFQLRRMGTAAAVYRAGWGTLQDYLLSAEAASTTDNTIARILTWPHPKASPEGFIDPRDDEEILDVAMSSLDRFSFVGVVEDDHHLCSLSDWLGAPVRSTWLNERASQIPSRLRPDFGAELVPETRALLAHRTRIDEKLWRAVWDRTRPSDDHVLSCTLDRAVRRYDRAFQSQRPSVSARRAAESVWDYWHRART